MMLAKLASIITVMCLTLGAVACMPPSENEQEAYELTPVSEDFLERRFTSGDGRLLIRRAIRSSVFEQACNLTNDDPPCDVIENYLWEVKIDDIGVIINFQHRSQPEFRAAPDYLYAIQCVAQGADWFCVTDHRS